MVDLKHIAVGVAAVAATAAVVLSIRAAANEDPAVTRARRRARRERRRKAAEGFSRERLLAIFADLDAAVNKIMAKLFQIEQRVRQQSKMAGQELNEMEVRQALLQQFVQLMQQSDAQVYASHATTEAEVRAATKLHGSDAKVKEHVEKIRKVFKVLSGEDEKPVEVPAHITSAKVLEMMEEICRETCALLDRCVAEIKAENPSITEDAQIGPAMQTNMAVGMKFQQFHAQGSAVRKAVHEKYGVEDDRVLHQFMKEHQHDEEFMQEVMRIGQAQHAKMAALGLA